MSLSVAYRNTAPLPDERPEKVLRTVTKKEKPISDFARRMSIKQHKRALKKFAPRIAAIQEYFPGWMPTINLKR